MTGEDPYGAYYDLRLKDGAAKVGFIVHKGDSKDPGADMFLMVEEHGREVWLVSGSSMINTEAPDVSALAFGDLRRARAHWVASDLLIWKKNPAEGDVFRLHYSPAGGLELTVDGVAGGESVVLTPDPAGMTDAIRARFPHLGRRGALRLDADDAARAGEMLRGQLAVSVTDAEGKLKDATGVQIPGVLDDRFAYEGPLGLTWSEGLPTLHLWAPTALSVHLHLFDGARATDAVQVLDMNEANGVWSVTGDATWNRMYFLYEVEVFMPATMQVEKNLVTDPYSRSLARNSEKSQIVNLDDDDLKPPAWDALEKPALTGPEDIVLYELHVRDFSALDPTVPEAHRGTFLAFADDGAGAEHLGAIAEAGVSHIHLLPVFDIATIDEDRANWPPAPDFSGLAPDSEVQQEALSAQRDSDGYNWGYDPFHFGVPEGSYATDPDGKPRIVEFRQMVQALAAKNLRVVMDVVYNHTNSSGMSDKSVFDKIVPGYYHRLNADGRVETSTCCQNTATEHFMMERFMIDDLVHWAVDFKVDGFRFDLMGHHMVRNMEKALAALRALTPEEHGVDGSKIYIYGEGWNFGEIADGKRGKNATQHNMYGTGIGTFNDRIRDAIRGGSAFSDPRDQGFVTGLWFDPNGFNAAGSSEKGRLLDAADRIRIGLAGNLMEYRLVTHDGRMTRGGDYSAVAYAASPIEAINYASAHDNQSLFDKIAYAAPSGASIDDRVAIQNLALSIVAFGQGIPFFHAGSDMLRSKSLDQDSYNSGDWFNRLDFSYDTNNFGVGLPPAEKNRDRWGIIRGVLANPEIAPSQEQILATVEHFREALRVRRSSPLFGLTSAEDVKKRVAFHNTGPTQVPGLIVMSIDDDVDGFPSIDPNFRRVVVLFNATKEEQTIERPIWQEGSFVVHPEHAASQNQAMQAAQFDPGDGAFTAPPRTAVVFVEAD